MKHTILATCIAGLIASSIPNKLAAADPVDADILLVGGTLHIGDGAASYVGDVAIRGDKIVAIGAFDHGEIKKRIACDGLIISPGFIDLHNHSDTPLTGKNREKTHERSSTIRLRVARQSSLATVAVAQSTQKRITRRSMNSESASTSRIFFLRVRCGEKS